MRRPLFLTAAIVWISGCGPVQSSSLIVDAQAELAAAQTAGAEKQAVFEYTAAEEYLHKAREEQSYADFEVSVKFARKSRDCARAARQLSEKQTRAGMGVGGDAPAKTSKCRPGPEREGIALDASEEPAAKAVAEPADPKPFTPAKTAPVKTTQPVKKAAPTTTQPTQPAQPGQTPAKKVAPIKPKDTPLPEGDAEEGSQE